MAKKSICRKEDRLFFPILLIMCYIVSFILHCLRGALVSRIPVDPIETTKPKTQTHVKCVLNSNLLIHKIIIVTNFNMTRNKYYVI